MINKLKCLRPDEPILGLDGLAVGDFWSWAYSDVLSNLNRSVFAEFIVGSALQVIKAPRVEWDFVDLYYRGKRIEVKASGFVNWLEGRPSPVRFDIAKKIPWDASTNTYGSEQARSADC